VRLVPLGSRPSQISADLQNAAEPPRKSWERLGRFRGCGRFCDHLVTHVWCFTTICASLLVILVTNDITVHGMGTRNASLVCLSTYTNFFSAEPVQQRWQNVVRQMIENI